MNNFLQKITGSVAIEVGSPVPCMGNDWLGACIFLFLFLIILIITTSIKSKRVAEQKRIIQSLRKKLNESKNKK